MGHAKAVLFIDDHQSEIFENHVLGQQPMGADDDVDAASGSDLSGCFAVRRAAKAVEAGNIDRKALQPFGKGLGMLFGKDGGRNQNGHLIAIFDDLEGGPHCDLGFAVTDIAADQPVHRPVAGEVADDIVDRLLLAGGFIKGKGFLQFVEESAGRGKLLAFAAVPVWHRYRATPGQPSIPLP